MDRPNGGGGIWRSLAARLAGRRIVDTQGLTRFLQIEAARTGQAALFGYLKARMGARHPILLQDAGYQPALCAAQEAVFAAGLSDLAVFATGLLTGGRAPDARLAAGLCDCVRRAALAGGLPPPVAEALTATLARRLAGHDWTVSGDAVFSESPAALLASAPVAEAYRRQDREMIVNSLRFQWIGVRRRLRRRLDPARTAAALMEPAPGT